MAKKCFIVNRRFHGTSAASSGYTLFIMQPRRCNFVGLVLALLLFGLSVVPAPGRAEAQMRCAGTSPHAAPCARVEIPAAGLTEKQISAKLMACCHSMRGCSMPFASPMPHGASQHFSGHRCLVTIHIFPTNAKAPGASRARWLLTASPTLAPPQTASASFPIASSPAPVLCAADSVLPPHTLTHAHGLRAPPAA